MTLKRFALVALALVVVGALVWGFLPKPIDVEVGAVHRGPLRVTVDEEGETRVRDRYVVSDVNDDYLAFLRGLAA